MPVQIGEICHERSRQRFRIMERKMTAHYVRGLVLVIAAIAAGCNREGQRSQAPEQLKGRLDAANGISNSSEKNEALKSVALDAADSGVVEVAVKALEGISNSSMRSEVAATC